MGEPGTITDLSQLFADEMERTRHEDGSGYVSLTLRAWTGEILLTIGSDEDEVTEGVNGTLARSEELAPRLSAALNVIQGIADDEAVALKEAVPGYEAVHEES